MAVTVATVATIACSSSSQNAVVNAKPTSVQQKAAFLETFDDGISAWIKSEVEQYTGTIDRSTDLVFLLLFVFCLRSMRESMRESMRASMFDEDSRRM